MMGVCIASKDSFELNLHCFRSELWLESYLTIMVVLLWDKQNKGKQLLMQNTHSLMNMTSKPRPWNTGGTDCTTDTGGWGLTNNTSLTKLNKTLLYNVK